MLGIRTGYGGFRHSRMLYEKLRFQYPLALFLSPKVDSGISATRQWHDDGFAVVRVGPSRISIPQSIYGGLT